jgi:hypothetical protein
MSDNMPISAGEVTHEEYWFIQVSGLEWTYVIQKLIEKHLKEIPIAEKPIILGSTVEQEPIWMLRKKFLPAEAIAHATGIKLETVLSEPTLKLSVTPKEGLAKPTVEYWGTA